MSQTMNPNARRSMPGAPAPGMQLYDAPNCDYEPPKNFQQNFGEDPLLQRGNISTCPIGNPYDCPEGFYNGSMMSSQGYSQVHNSRKHKQNWFKYQGDLDMHQSNIVRCPTSCRRLPIMFLFSHQVSDYQAHPGMQGQQQMMLPGQILAQQAMMQQVRWRHHHHHRHHHRHHFTILTSS